MTSTFSCDIARSVSRAFKNLGRAAEDQKAHSRAIRDAPLPSSAYHAPGVANPGERPDTAEFLVAQPLDR
jgi:hypothetical protein